MDRLEHALKEALARNKLETEKWTKYLEEHEQAIENMVQFGKKLRLDVMVPIGSKAFMPGELYHTNEIFVSHYRGIFSKCSSVQAQEIGKYRINMAKERLLSLEKERDMYQNKLDVPYLDGALPSEGEKEIIEEYDEEKEKLWREEHKKRVRAAKLKEAEEKKNQQSTEKSHEDVIKLLEDMEMMEELEKELENLEVEDDDTLQQIMSGEIPIPSEKKRVSHYDKKEVETVGDSVNEHKATNTAKNVEMDNLYNKYSQQSLQETTNIDYTNNNTIPNADFQANEESDSDASSDDEVSDQILEYEKEVEGLPLSKRLKFFKSKVKEIEHELSQIKIQTANDLEHKMSRIELREDLLDYIEMLRSEADQTVEEEQFEKMLEMAEKNVDKKKKKRISFAQQDEIRLINKNEAASAVSRKENEYNYKISAKNILIEEIDKKKVIQEKVEQSYKFTSENQSQQDFDLIGKILGTVESKDKTLFIKFNHSSNKFNYPGYEIDNTSERVDNLTIGSPADIYRVFSTYFPEDVQKRQHQEELLKSLQDMVIENKSPTVKESKDLNSNEPITKSILKNKDSVKQETPAKLDVKKPKKKRKNKEDEGFGMILGDVVEKKVEPLLEPEPLPTEKFVDAHAPKKRVSRFKEMRSNIS